MRTTLEQIKTNTSPRKDKRVWLVKWIDWLGHDRIRTYYTKAEAQEAQLEIEANLRPDRGVE